MNFYYLLANFCSIISYDIARSITSFATIIAILGNNQIPIKVIQVFWYADIIVLLLAVPGGFFIKKKWGVNVFSMNLYAKNWFPVLLLIPQVFSSNYKSFLASNLKGSVILTYSLFTPFVAMLMSFLIFKNERLPKNFFVAFLLCFIGFFLTKYEGLGQLELSWILIGYVFVNAVSTIATRFVAKKRKNIEGMVFENAIYAIQGLLFFYIFGGKTVTILGNSLQFDAFNWKYLFSWQVWLATIPATAHHILLILGVQSSKFTGTIIMSDLVKVILAYISALIFFGNIPSLLELVGVFIICTSVYIFNKNILNNLRKLLDNKFLIVIIILIISFYIYVQR